MSNNRTIVMTHRIIRSSSGSDSDPDDPEDIICLTDELEDIMLDERNRVLLDGEEDIA